MDYIPSREQDYSVDLERGGGPTSEELPSSSPPSGAKLAMTFVSKFREFVSNDAGSIIAENGAISSGNTVNNGEVSPENLKEAVEKKMGKKKNKKPSAKKPPRPPRGLSLDAADQKLIREIADIALLKRARIERMKALKKMKASKASSTSSGNLFAMLFTVLFCLVILFQGMSSGSSAVGFQGSPEAVQGKEGGFLLMSNHWNPYASNTNIPGPASPRIVEQVAGLDSEHKKVSRAAR